MGERASPVLKPGPGSVRRSKPLGRHVALLRGINVGGKQMIAMARLREVLQSRGFGNVRTLLQSGNVLLESKSSGAELERQLEQQIAVAFSVHCKVFVRNAEEWAEALRANPFPETARSDPSHLLVMFFREELDIHKLEPLRAAHAGPENMEARGRELFLLYPEGIGRSKLTNTFIEKKLALPGTARNWNTVQKIASAFRQ